MRSVPPICLLYSPIRNVRETYIDGAGQFLNNAYLDASSVKNHIIPSVINRSKTCVGVTSLNSAALKTGKSLLY